MFHSSVDEEGHVFGEFTATGALPRCLHKIEPARGALDYLFKSNYLRDTLGPQILQNPDITEIMVNGTSNVWIEERGKLRPAPEIRFRDQYHLLNVINTIIAPLNRRLDELNPMVDARLPDDERFPGGGRINAVLDPISLVGPVLTIRRFSRTPFTLDRLVVIGSMSPQMAAFLRTCVPFMTVADHLTLNERWQRAKKAKDPGERTRVLAVYHAKQGITAKEVAKITLHSVRWVQRMVRRSNQKGPEALKDRRHQNPGQRGLS
nr:ATPase, T2SS/T4P/T4SS family [Chloroflexus sp.]